MGYSWQCQTYLCASLRYFFAPTVALKQLAHDSIAYRQIIAIVPFLKKGVLR